MFLLLKSPPARKVFSVSITFVCWQTHVISYSTSQFSTNTFLNTLICRVFCVMNFGHITSGVGTVDGTDTSKPLPGYNTKTRSFIPHNKKKIIYF